MVECLIRNSVDVNAKDSQGNSPLVLALKKGQEYSVILHSSNGTVKYAPMFFIPGNDEITVLLIGNGSDSYLRRKNASSTYFGCITRNGNFG